MNDPTRRILVGLTGIAVAVSSPLHAQTADELELAVGAKVLCSAEFVVGRDADEYARNDDFPPIIGSDRVEIHVDREAKKVELWLDGGRVRKRAVYNGDQGCSIIPDGEDGIFFTPVDVVSSLLDPTTQRWPMGDVLPDDPVDPLVNEEALKAAVDMAFEPEAEKTRSFLVVHKGNIIAERYAQGFDKDTRNVSWSMGKSITATLFALLVRDGHHKVSDLAPIAEWRDPDDPRSQIRIEDLLHMSGGLNFKYLRGDDFFEKKSDHFYIYSGAIDAFEWSITRPAEHPPNTVWQYLNCDPLTIGKIIRDTVEARGENYLTFPQRELFDKIGMRSMVLEPDPYGNFLLTGYDYGTARDWARLGLLHLWDGEWLGERILPEGWVDFVTTPAPASEGRYGAFWWLSTGGQLPEDAYWASGAMGQRTTVIPSHDLVIVRQGYTPRGTPGGHLTRVIAAVVDAVSGGTIN